MSHQTEVGGRVLYRLDDTDADQVNARRANFQAFNQGRSGHKHPHGREVREASGHVAHIGTPVRAGQEFAADICAIPDPPRLNLRVLLDGSDVHWVTSVAEGTGPGTWSHRGPA